MSDTSRALHDHALAALQHDILRIRTLIIKMGGRLSMPRGPGGMTEMSDPKTSPFPRRSMPINSRTIIAPAAALTMACLLFVYTRTSIRAAKANAQRHREADSGGEGLNLLNESRRRHGRMERLDEGSTIGELAKGAREQLLGRKAQNPDKSSAPQSTNRSEEELKLRAAMGRRGDS